MTVNVRRIHKTHVVLLIENTGIPDRSQVLALDQSGVHKANHAKWIQESKIIPQITNFCGQY